MVQTNLENATLISLNTYSNFTSDFSSNYTSYSNLYSGIYLYSTLTLKWSSQPSYEKSLGLPQTLTDYTQGIDVVSLVSSLKSDISLTNDSPYTMLSSGSKYIYLVILAGVSYIINNSPFKNQYYQHLAFSTIFQKANDLGEQEYGAFDDFQFLLTYLFYMFATYLWVVFSWYTLNMASNS